VSPAGSQAVPQAGPFAEWNGVCYDKDNRKERPDLVTVNLASRDLLGSSSELPLGFALRAYIQPEVCPHYRAIVF
jgi:hypothetical protein